MKRSKVDKIFVEETHRKRKILALILLITIVSFLSVSLIFIYLQKNRKEFIKYTENSDIDYKVYLKENDFFTEKYLDRNREYVASLIDYINAEFKYKITMDAQNVDFVYTTKIESEVNVYNTNGKKPLYKVTEILMDEKTNYSVNGAPVNVNEVVQIDYNHYNDIISSFERTYGLNDVVSNLIIKMYINVKGNCNDVEDNDNQSVISLNIPLTEKTVSIEMESDLVKSNEVLLVCKKADNLMLYLIGGTALLLLDIYISISTGIYVVKSRSAKDMYKKELKRILSNYHSFIQKVNSDFKFTGYQVLKVDTFTDMLEIRDTLNQPILMIESKEKNGAHFIIPSNTKILYTYSLKEKSFKK